MLDNDTPNDAANLANGTYKGGTRRAIAWKAIGQGTNITGDVTLDGLCQVVGCKFDGTVTLTATALCVFLNCEFTKAVTVANGGKLAMTAGLYDNIQNAGAAGNCNAIGNRKTGATANTNVTVTGQI